VDDTGTIMNVTSGPDIIDTVGSLKETSRDERAYGDSRRVQNGAIGENVDVDPGYRWYVGNIYLKGDSGAGGGERLAGRFDREGSRSCGMSLRDGRRDRDDREGDGYQEG